MLRAIAVVPAIAVAALLVFASTRPDTLRVEQSTVVETPPARVHSLIDDFQRGSPASSPAWMP